jgi:hypothetical protein
VKAAPGNEGKWFAAAKEAGLYDERSSTSRRRDRATELIRPTSKLLTNRFREEQPARGSQAWTRRGALADGQLVPQRQIFEHQDAAGSEHAEEAGEDEGNHAGHHRSGGPELQC